MLAIDSIEGKIMDQQQRQLVEEIIEYYGDKPGTGAARIIAHAKRKHNITVTEEEINEITRSMRSRNS